MQAMIDIPEPLVEPLRARIEREGFPPGGVPVQAFATDAPDGSFVFHVTSIAFPVPEPQAPAKSRDPQKAELEAQSAKLPSWFGLARNDVRHDVPHDMESIRESIGRGIAAELAEKETGLMFVAEA